MARRKISNSQAVCIILLWGTLCYMLLAYSEITFYTIFVLVASAIIVFIPLYKSRRNHD